MGRVNKEFNHSVISFREPVNSRIVGVKPVLIAIEGSPGAAFLKALPLMQVEEDVTPRYRRVV